jgi:hypothetical protein
MLEEHSVVVRGASSATIVAAATMMELRKRKWW